jgi:hypothetical protein
MKVPAPVTVAVHGVCAAPVYVTLAGQLTVVVELAFAIVSARVAVPVPPALVAERPTLNEPGAVGVPEITPVVSSLEERRANSR